MGERQMSLAEGDVKGVWFELSPLAFKAALPLTALTLIAQGVAGTCKPPPSPSAFVVMHINYFREFYLRDVLLPSNSLLTFWSSSVLAAFHCANDV